MSFAASVLSNQFLFLVRAHGTWYGTYARVRREVKTCLDLGDEAGDRGLLLLAGGEILVPLHQSLAM